MAFVFILLETIAALKGNNLLDSAVKRKGRDQNLVPYCLAAILKVQSLQLFGQHVW